MSGFGDRLLDDLGPSFVRLAGPLLPPVVEALVAPIAEVDDLLQPTPGGWATFADLDTTPQPWWFGQVVGVTVDRNLSAEGQREQVRSRPAARRGSPAAINAAVQALLTGTKTVVLFERDGSPWRLRVRVYEAEVPAGVTAAVIKAAVTAQKPVGIVVNVEIRPAASYDHFAAEHGPAYSDAASDFASYDSARTHVPEEGTIA